MSCPTCGRRPSERWAPFQGAPVQDRCPDPIHDLADAAPELLRRIVEEYPDPTEHKAIESARALLAKLADS